MFIAQHIGYHFSLKIEIKKSTAFLLSEIRKSPWYKAISPCLEKLFMLLLPWKTGTYTLFFENKFKVI